MSDLKTSLQRFVGNHVCLIVETSQAFAVSIQAQLYELGVPRGQVLIAWKYEDAQRHIAEKKPKVLITEYQIGAKLGLSLVDLQHSSYAENERISIIITRNSADSVIAEAAEEQVDAFLLKPFSPENFHVKLKDVLARKTNPTPYLTKIAEGRAHLHNKDFAQAIDAFTQAKALDPAPALACYYAGQAALASGFTDRALNEYREGLKHKPLHYSCLTAEFELHVRDKNFAEAYALSVPLKTTFPLTPKRLGQIILATVFAKHFGDLGELHQLYTELEVRPEELVKIMAMALFASGKHFLSLGERKHAGELFDKGLMTAGKDLAYLDKIIAEYLKAGALADARAFLSKAPPATLGSPEYTRLAFKVDSAELSPDLLVERGRKLIMEDHGTPEIFETVVRIMAQAGKTTLAEAVISRAVKSNPEMRAQLYAILEEKAGGAKH